MALSLVPHDNPVLRARCEPVMKITPEIGTLIRGMLHIIDASGHSIAGLAAPQVGVPVRIFVIASNLATFGINGMGEATPAPRVYINPVFTRLSGPRRMVIEGCMSLPGRSAGRTRWLESEIEHGIGNTRAKHASAHPWIARVWQHEMDHLNGRLIVDGDMPSEYGGDI